MKTGILGGTFNPVHLAHLRIAEEVLEACSLDRVLFIPAAIPPHKEIAEDVPFSHRLAMTEAAIADNPAFAVSDLEARREGKSYSVHTLEILRRKNPEDELFFIIGMDSYRDIATWREYRQLFSLANIVVAARPGVLEKGARKSPPVAIRGEFCYTENSNLLSHKSGNSVIFIEETFLDISSTHIRQLVAEGRSIRYLVPPAVEDYIYRHALYQSKKLG